MPVTRSENIQRIRSLLDNPYPNTPSWHQYLRLELSEEQDITNELNNTGKPWGLVEYQLNYTPATPTYTINVTDWGKVFYVVKETTNPFIPFLPVPFQDVQDQLYGSIIGWFNNSYSQAFALSETPERMSFYRAGTLNAQPSVKIEPMPAQSATYIITYLPGYLGTADPLETAIQLPEHAELIRLRSATSLLPYAKWSEDESFNQIKRKEMAAGFQYQLERKEANYRKYIKSINKPRATTIDSWNAYS